MNYQMLVDTAVLAGEIMLVSGAEVYRIEDTVGRILKYSQLESIEVFTLATGIFATLSDPSIGAITVVKRVDKRATNLNRIYCVNEVSRQFCSGDLTLEEAYVRLRKISVELQYRQLTRGIGYVMTAAFFAILFGGGIWDCAAAGASGVAMAAGAWFLPKLRFNDFCQNAAVAFAGAVIALLLQKTLLPDMNVDAVIISAMMPLVPGVTFTSAIRDTLNGDYSSGVSRIAEAIVVALAVASGVGSAMMMFRVLGGVL